MKFDIAIGNPPFHQDAVGDNSDKPVFHIFMDASYEVADKIELITPARFLFNAGATPKDWNKKMLNSKHLKVLHFERNAQAVFPTTTFTGGVVITLFDNSKEYEPIEVFTDFPELNSLKESVWKGHRNQNNLESIFTNRGCYKYSDRAYDEIPYLPEKTADRRLAPSCFERMPELFLKEKPEDENEYIQIFGVVGGKREFRWFRKDYVRDVESLDKYKVFVPKANGASGMLGDKPARIISKPEVGLPNVGSTETFISCGSVDKKSEAEAILKYIKTKFARALLGILKVTQNNPKQVWKYVPLQDFTENSDIDWSKSIPEIDQQLYKKYGLTDEEIAFIEEKVQAME